jgi:hypothetical protein
LQVELGHGSQPFRAKRFQLGLEPPRTNRSLGGWRRIRRDPHPPKEQSTTFLTSAQ